MAILITASGILFKQNFLRMTPLYISLFVMILSAQVSRYAFLVGSLNSILYAVIYFYYGLYAVAFEALLFSFPMQMISFFRWKKHADSDSVFFKKMNKKQLALAVVIFVVAWFAQLFILKKSGSDYAYLDNTASLFGIVICILQALTFIEYTYLMIPSGLIGIALYVQVITNTPEQMPYLIYSLYSFVCIVIQFFNARKRYKAQQLKKQEETV